MQRLSVLVLLCLTFLATTTLATRQLPELLLDPTIGDDHKILIAGQDTGQTLSLEFSLPYLNREEIVIEGETFLGLTYPGAELRGEIGQAALPTISRLILIPDNAAVKIDVTSKHEQVLQNILLFPVQPDEGNKFEIDHSYYRSAQADAPPLVEVGAPGILHGLRVVPITINPVSYTPATGEVRIADRIDIELDFNGTDTSNGTTPERTSIPASFQDLYRQTVVNYRDDGTPAGPGTYLVIMSDDPAVPGLLEPLLEWRRQQGYNVLTVSTQVSGNTTTGVKNYIQDVFDTCDPPLEYVVLAGDADGSYLVPAWRETVSGYNGEGDHYYTMLAGDDLLADVHIGRLSFRTTTELTGIVDKIVTYETDPPTSDSGWFTRAGLTGDPGASGITTIFVNQWVKSHLLDLGYTQIDTIWGGNFASLMTASINQGLTAFGYRGYVGMSGFGTGHIGSLNNGYKLPFAVIPTCASGSFWSSDNAPSEAFLRNPNGGGIGSIGTATTGTHTRFNNCYYMGTWDGALFSAGHQLGVAHTSGKLAVYINYSGWQGNIAEIWSVWNNLMGDPATPMWTALPGDLDVAYPDVVPDGAVSVPVYVTSNNISVQGAMVALYKAGEVQSAGYTDYTGSVNLPLAGYTTGQLKVTVTMPGYVPYSGSLNIGTVATYPALAGITVDDDSIDDSSGNDDGVVNPGESIELTTALHNYGESGVSAVSAVLSTTDPYVTLTDDSETYGDISSGQTVWCAEDFDFTVLPSAPDGHVINFELTPDNGATTWPASLIQLTIASSSFEYEEFTWSGGGLTPDPGENGQLLLSINNSGSLDAIGVQATLETSSPWIVVTDDAANYGTINAGATAENLFDTFYLEIAGECFNGHPAAFRLTLEFSGGHVATTEFNLTIGAVESSDPLGPDAYGYYAFDNTDAGYPYVPGYWWTELDPNYGGSGISAGLDDFGWEQDDIETFALPFTFQYYGQAYNEVSICSNGFIALGRTSLKPYRNFSIPGINAPPNMIAPYWDNLYQSGTNMVYYKSDPENGRFLVEWSRLRAQQNNAVQNVQVILYDPAMHPTATGDGRIKFQYQQVANSDNVNGYATVGIMNSDLTDGLCYTYANSYPDGAASLAAGRAISFEPIALGLNPGTLTGVVTNASNGNTPLADVAIRVVEQNLTMTSALDGSYTGNIPAGTYIVRAEHGSFAALNQTGVEITAGEITELDFALTDIVGPAISNTTVLPFTDDTTGPYVVDAYITDYSSLVEKHFYYRIDGAVTQEADLILVDAISKLYRAEIPGQPLNTQVQYWIEATDAAGNLSLDPAEGSYDFWILEFATVFADDMETDRGWTVGGPDDTATYGIWVREDPIGVWNGMIEVQPEDDATLFGTLCWITGNNEDGTQGTDDVDDGQTTLNSPIFDLSETSNVTVSYRRWYTNDTGNNPNEDYWVVEVNDGNGWVQLESINISDRHWTLQSFLLSDYIDMTATVQMRFIASDNGGASLVEAGVDNFLLQGFLAPIVGVATEQIIPTRLALNSNVPNPFNPATRISFDLPNSQAISLRVFDINGRLVRTLVSQQLLPAGVHDRIWNGRDDQANPVASGIYFCVLDTPSRRLSGKMTLMK